MSENHSEECDFTCHQWPDGTIKVVCDVKTEDGDIVFKEGNFEVDYPQQLSGITESGKSIVVKPTTPEDPLLFGLVPDSRSFNARSCEVKGLGGEYRLIGSIKYTLVNLLLPGREIEFDLSGEQVILKKDMGYKKKKSLLKEWKDPQVTTKATINYPGAENKANKIINKLCRLFTLGGNSKVNWIYYENCDVNGNLLKRFHGDRVTKGYTPLYLVPKLHLKEFIENSYSNYDYVQSVLKVYQTINAYNDAKMEDDYLELRGLKLINVIEYVRRSFLEDTDSKHNWRKDNQGKLNRVDFAEAIEKLVSDLGLSNEITQIERMKDNRNNLVHEMNFYEKEDSSWRAYTFLLNFVGKILLGLFGYQGEYLDWEYKYSNEGTDYPADITKTLCIDTRNRDWPFSI